MYFVKAYIDDDMVLHLCPRNQFEAIGLQATFGKEIMQHGPKLVKIETEPGTYEKVKHEHEHSNPY